MTGSLNSKTNSGKVLLNAFMVVLIMFIFLVSLKMMGDSFKLFGKDLAYEIINATSNPFVSLFIGLLATAIIQSSSTTTSMVVTMVAAGTLTIENAIPMIMGANIGTSVTSSIVSFGHIGNKKEYRKAISAATVHDFFNIMVVLFLFPLEYFFSFLSGISDFFAGLFSQGVGESEKIFSLLGVTVKPTAKFIIELFNKNAWLSLITALGLLFFSLRYLTVLLKKLLIGKAEKKLNKLIFSKPIKSLGWGALLTTVVQSSSVTTSLIVPMVASNKVSLRKAFPFLIGANIGTTITALIAALSTDASEFKFALTIALAHVLFNVLGATIIFPIRFLREIPVKLSRKLGRATMKNRLVGMAYIVVTFFLIPFLLILVSGSKSAINEYEFVTTEMVSGKKQYFVLKDKVRKGSSIIQRSIFKDVKDLNNYNLSNPTSSQDVYISNAVINIGKDLYMTSPVGFCFDRTELGRKVELCVKEMITDFNLNNHVIDTCFVFTKKHYNLTSIDSITDISYLYLDKKNLMIVKEEVFDKKQKLIKRTELK